MAVSSSSSSTSSSTTSELSASNDNSKLHNRPYLLGSMPDYELRILPRWLFFSENDGYQHPQYTYFSVQNNDNCVVAFRFRTKDRNLVLFSPGHGFLGPKETVKVTMVVTGAERWQREPAAYVGKVHKVIAENLIVNADLKIPENSLEQRMLCREVFAATRQATGNRGELNIYTKIRVVLPFHDFTLHA